jgi:hypothetical protein
MRTRHLGLLAAVLGGCVPPEPEWLITRPRFRGVEVEVVQSGGYASLLNVPPGGRRATVLPLDVVELEWAVAAPEGVTVQPPIWVLCGAYCYDLRDFALPPDVVEDCPDPLPFDLRTACRIGEGHRRRVTLGGAFTSPSPFMILLVVGSRRPDLAPATCLERLTKRPLAQLESCIVSQWLPDFGPSWAALPFDPEASAVPPEVLAEEADVHPELLGFTIGREQGPSRTESLVDVGASVLVRRGERITVAPRFADGAAQQYWLSRDDVEGMPWSGTLESYTEHFQWRAWFSAPVDEFWREKWEEWTDEPVTWVVPDDFESTLLFLDVEDDRAGHAFVDLRFVADDAS